ncbi:hypothetical protein AA313_de0200840 [Arthrobotrys entomopaga]|nr:hypothetical protein AA313_de0200840 [Arthrobotrys entomopaga]
MPTPFKPPSSQPITGDRVIFPSEQPRIGSTAPTGPTIQPPNVSVDEGFRSPLSPHVPANNGLGLHTLHTSSMNINKSGTNNDDQLVFHTYSSPLDGQVTYNMPGMDYNAAVLSMSYNPPSSEDQQSNVLTFYPNSDGNLKIGPRGEPSYNAEAHIPSHNVVTALSSGPSQSQIKDEQPAASLSRRGSHTLVATNASKAATISGLPQKAIPPPINTDTQSHQVPGGTKSQHNTWRRGNKGRTPLSVKRSQSTPNVQLAAQLAAASAVSAPPIPSASTTDDLSPVTLAYQLDKKRNKLGYHRTSVACGDAKYDAFWPKMIVDAVQTAYG